MITPLGVTCGPGLVPEAFTVSVTLSVCGLLVAPVDATCTLPKYVPGASPCGLTETLTGLPACERLKAVPEPGFVLSQFPPLRTFAVMVHGIDPAPVLSTWNDCAAGAEPLAAAVKF